MWERLLYLDVSVCLRVGHLSSSVTTNCAVVPRMDVWTSVDAWRYLWPQ